MTKKKVCLIGSFGVGKTSLVAQFVQGIFSEKYLTTVGVKIDRKTVVIGDTEVLMLIWDLAGEDEFERLKISYLRGAAGFIYVADGTRAETIDQAIAHRERIAELIPDAADLFVVNKADLSDAWELDDRQRECIGTFQSTSAKNGDGVEQVFATLAESMIRA